MTVLRSLPAGLFAALLLAACAQQPQASNPSRFAATPPTIDGQATDWQDSLRYDADTKLQYAVLNDNRAVYVRLKAADPATQGRLLRTGFTVWLDTTGRNQQQFGVRYTLPREPTPAEGAEGTPAAPPPGVPYSANDRRALLAKALAGAQSMELLNYKGNKEPTFTDTQSPLGVKLATALDAQDNLIYELAVPLRLLYRKVPDLAGGKRATVGVTILSTRLPVASPASGNDNNMSVVGSQRGMGGGMGGMRGGGMPRGGGYYGPAPLSLKTSVQLSHQ